ncbi:hypothetical protein B0H11DRAFT_2240828 [Mycena galericulata]|nr:hypothetical protein B0H11DRAFT_2240828 [Mycena galericulata]
MPAPSSISESRQAAGRTSPCDTEDWSSLYAGRRRCNAIYMRASPNPSLLRHERGHEGIDDDRYFHGFEIQARLKAPESDECCMSGCAVCVYDLYEEDLAAYSASLDGLRATLTAKGIPEAAWPEGVRVRGRGGDEGGGGSRGDTLSALEALEKALADKRAKVEPE